MNSQQLWSPPKTMHGWRRTSPFSIPHSKVISTYWWPEEGWSFFLLRVSQAPVCGFMPTHIQQELIRHLVIFLKRNKNRKFARGGFGGTRKREWNGRSGGVVWGSSFPLNLLTMRLRAERGRRWQKALYMAHEHGRMGFSGRQTLVNQFNFTAVYRNI